MNAPVTLTREEAHDLLDDASYTLRIRMGCGIQGNDVGWTAQQVLVRGPAWMLRQAREYRRTKILLSRETGGYTLNCRQLNVRASLFTAAVLRACAAGCLAGAPGPVVVTASDWIVVGPLHERTWLLTGNSAARVFPAGLQGWRWMAFDVPGQFLGTGHAATVELARAADATLTTVVARASASATWSTRP